MVIKYENIHIMNQALRTSFDVLKFDFSVPSELNWAAKASFTLMIISLRDLVWQMDHHGYRAISDNDLPTGTDITKRIIDMRNAVCHLGSPLRQFGPDGNTLSFGMKVGAGTLIDAGEVVLNNPYNDDIAFFYGELRLLLKRQIIPTLETAETVAQCLARSAGFHWFPVQ